MKIPLIIGISTLFLIACVPTKKAVVPTTATNSELVSSSEVKSVVISTKHKLRFSVYVAGDVVMVQPINGVSQRLTGINPALYSDFKQGFFRIQDKNHDGINELAVLSGTNTGASELCYDVFAYNLVTQAFERKWEDFFCTKK